MDNNALKAQITELLMNVEDERFLQSLNAMLQTFVDDKIVLTTEEKAAVKKGEEDAEAGNVVTHQQIMQKSKARYPNLQPKSWK